MCSGSVVVTAYAFESGHLGSNPDWGMQVDWYIYILFFYLKSLTNGIDSQSNRKIRTKLKYNWVPKKEVNNSLAMQMDDSEWNINTK